VTIDACGYRTYPEIGTTALPGGGRPYNYYVNGAVTKVIAPPAGFRPLTASPAQLDEYGFPSRPSDPGDLLQWQEEFSNYSGAISPTSFLAQAVLAADQHPEHWAGYYATAPATSSFTQAATTYIEPSENPNSVCVANAHDAAIWAGLSGSTSSGHGAIAQDGTVVGNPAGLADIGVHQAWYEFFGKSDTGQVPVFRDSAMATPMTATANYPFDVSVKYVAVDAPLRTGRGYHFFYYNYKTHISLAFDLPPPSGFHTTLKHAEIVVEDPSNAAQDLTDLVTSTGPMRFRWSRLNTVRLQDWHPQKEFIHDHLKPPGDMAEPGSIGGYGYFTVTVHHCQAYAGTSGWTGGY
jgi:hypothetical protein